VSEPVTNWTPDGEVPVALLPSEHQLIEACATVFDPEIPINIYELGLIYAIEIGSNGAVEIEMTLTAPSCPSAQELPEQVQSAILSVSGVKSCNVSMVWDPPWTTDRMSEHARLHLNIFG